MKPCTRQGIDITKRCQWKCKTCFYRYGPDFNTKYDKPVDKILSEALEGKRKGCDSVVITGFGEPMLHPEIKEICKTISQEMTLSIITNGGLPLKYYQDCLEYIDHLHISVHGIGKTLNEIAENPSAGKMQKELLEYLGGQFNPPMPWRSNTTLQKSNYKQLPEIAKFIGDHNARHFVSLGFLPHYEWKDRLKEVAVHPAELRPYIQRAIDTALDMNMYATIRYQPMCHLSPKYWKYVVNARYVVYDPFEWTYYLQPDATVGDMWINALNVGGSVAIQGDPCNECILQLHCGGWNKVYAAGFGGADLRAVTEIPDEYKEVINIPGGLHDMNPVNSISNKLKG